MIGRNDPCWCGSGEKWKKCHFPKPPEENKKLDSKTIQHYLRTHNIIIKNKEQIEGIRKSCQLASMILEATCSMAKAGITTLELNDFAHELHLKNGAIPAPLHYGSPPFPKSICTSINDVICHGIPDKTILKEGDIINIDVTCILNGYFGDCSKMVIIGDTSAEKQKVVNVSYECLMRSIAALKPGIPLSIIGDITENYAGSQGCSVVNQFIGHGVGIAFHEGPQVYHHRNSSSILLVSGMIFTIEPMINAGIRDAVIDRKDQWTAKTKDGKPSAQWEHTILITDSGHEILTNWKR